APADGRRRESRRFRARRECGPATDRRTAQRRRRPSRHFTLALDRIALNRALAQIRLPVIVQVHAAFGTSMISAVSVDRIGKQWDTEIVPQLIDYVRIPAKSPHFDPAWEANGHIESVISLAERWVRAQPVRGLIVEIVRLPGRTPVLVFEAPATTQDAKGTVLLYGHLDKQPEMTGWREGFGPWIPVIEEGRLYGRGSADDGYAVFAALSAIAALDAEGAPHARCVAIIETCEESGSYDLPAYLEMLAPRLGPVD